MKNKIENLTNTSANRPLGGFKMRSIIYKNGLARTMGVSFLALSMALGSVPAAFAVTPNTVDNTATATGTSPGGTPGDVTDDSNTVEVDLLDQDNSLSVSKAAAITTDGDTDGLGDAGDIITYTYTITNDGNSTLTAVGIDDTHDGSASLTTPGFSSWTTQGTSPAATGGDTTITMAPGSVAVFTTTYTITAADILASGGGGSPDGDIDNSAVAEGTSPGVGSTAGDTVSAASTASIPLDATASLDVAKAAYEGGVPPLLGGTGTTPAADRPVGTVITYVYTVTNDGDVPVDTVGLTDAHTGLGTLGTITYNSLTNTSTNSVYTTGNTVDTLYPGDIAYFTATYTITQADIDAQ